MTARSGSQKREPLPFCVLVGVLALSASHPLSSSPKGGAKGLTVTPTAAPTPETELTLSAARHTARRRSSAFWAACPKGPAGAPADCMRIYTCIA